MAMVSMILLLRKAKILYQLKKGGERISHLLFMDGLKLFPKSEDQLESPGTYPEGFCYLGFLSQTNKKIKILK